MILLDIDIQNEMHNLTAGKVGLELIIFIQFLCITGSWGMFSWVATIQYLTMAIRELGLLKLPNLLFHFVVVYPSLPNTLHSEILVVL